MNMIGALIAGLVAGLVGAGLWAGIAYFTGYEIGWIAWGIGALVGLAVALGAQGGTPATGVMAVLISLVAIAGGKYLAIEFQLNDYLSEGGTAEFFEDEDFVISFLADYIVYEKEDAGEVLFYSEDADRENPMAEKDYPAVVWAQAKAEYNAMSADEREAFKNDMMQQTTADMAEYRGEISQDAFWDSFGLFDLLFAGLAVVTAYSIGSKDLNEDDPADPAAPKSEVA